MVNLRGNKKIILIKMILSYIAILLIPLVMGSIIYYQSIQSGTKNAQEKNHMMLEQVRDVLDNRLNEVETLAQQLSLNEKVLSVLNIKDVREGSPEYIRVWDLHASLPKYKLLNKLIYDFYIFYKNNNITVTSNSAYFDSDKLYGSTFKYEDYDFEKWSQKLWGDYHNREYSVADKILINGYSVNVVCYMQSIPNRYGSKFEGVAAILINTQMLQNMLTRFELGSTGIVCITDNSGKIITYIAGKDAEIDIFENGADAAEKYLKSVSSSNNYVLSNTVSNLNGWNFISAIPSNIVMAEVNYIKSITIVLMFVTLFLGVLISYMLTYRKAKSLKNVIEKVKDVFDSESIKSRNEYHLIESAVSDLIESNIGLQKKMHEQTPLLEAALLRRLLHGEVQGGDEHRSLLKYTNMDIGNKYVSVVIIRMQDYGSLVNKQLLFEYDKTRVVIKSVLNASVEHQYYLLDMDEKTMVMLLVFDDDRQEDCKLQMKNLIDELTEILLEEYKIELFFAIADVHKNISNVHKAFMEARQVLDYKVFDTASKAIWYENLPIESENYYYPIDIELRLIGMVKSGDVTGVKETFRSIYIENFEKRQISPNMVQQLVLAMKNTVIRSIGSMSFNDRIHTEIEALDAVDSVDEIFNRVIRTNLEICKLINEQKQKEQSDLLNSILSHMDMVYQQSDLTLGVVAADFGVTETYVYQLFKGILGISFADYLENLRIKQACKFLSEGDISIRDIAARVGYNSDNSFRRAFKRIMGVPPSNYYNAVQ